MTTLKILEEARDRIRNPKNWCQGRCRWPEKDARCAVGAVWGVDDENGMLVCKNTFAACEPALAALAKAMNIPQGPAVEPKYDVPKYNDTHTHAEVLEAFNLAIAAELAKVSRSEERNETTTTSCEPVLSGAC